MKRIIHRRAALARFARRLVFIAAASLLLVAGSAYSSRETHAAQPENTMKVIVIPINGMSCSACAGRIKKALTSIEGVREAEVSLEKRNVRVKYEPSKLAPGRLVTAINDLGYQAGTPAEAK